MPKLALYCIFFLTSVNLLSQTKVSNKNGNWNDPTAWTPNGVPTSTDNVLISDGNTITFNANASINSMTLGTGGATAVFRYSGNTALTLSITNNLVLNSNGSILVLNTSNTTHTLNLQGDLINNGSFDMNRDGNSRCVALFSKNGNQNISGSGNACDFYLIVLNMGTSLSNILEITSSAFTVPNNFLQLTNGTFKLSTPNAATVVPFTGATTIPASASIWLNSPNAVMSTSNSINLSGLIRLSNGIMNIGNATNEDLTAGTGTLEIISGTLNIAGKYNASASATNFNMSGGVMNVASVLSSNTTIAPFQISAAGTVFNMSGGTIVVVREGGNGNQNLGFVNTGSSGGSVTGGSLQIGNASTPANQIMCINSTFIIPNLVLNSANATASVITNSLTVQNNLVINSGVLNDNTLTIAVGGNWTNNGGTYANNSGTVLFNSSSAAQSIFKSGGESFNNLSFSGAGLKSFASPVTAKGFTIQNSASVDVSAGNFQLNVGNNFVNNGSFAARNGLVQFNGTVSQSIAGLSVTNFFNLGLNNNAGAILNNAENLIGTLSLSNGTLNTNGQLFTMVSTSTATARVAQITGSGDISGNVTVQRFVPGGTTGWAFLGTPISSALTLQDWDDDLFISCPTCPDGTAAGFLSIYTYNEAATGLVDDPASYVPLNTITDPIVFGKGYWVYLGNGQFTTTDITLDVTGTLRKFNQNIPLSYSNYGSSVNDGWNLIHNPYPSAISWNLLRGATANLDNAIYVYNADLNSGAGGYASFVNGVSSPAAGSGGIDDNIPMAQGFYVHSTGATNISATESVKVSNNPVFLKTNNVVSPSLLRLQIKDTQLRDETVVYIQNNSSNGFNPEYDAFKLPGTDPSAPIIAASQGNLQFQIKAIPPVNGTYSTEVLVRTGVSGNYSVGITDFSHFPQGTCIRLIDLYNNTVHDLKSGDYAVYLYDTTSVSRFVLQITLQALSINSSSVIPTCTHPNGSYIAAIGNSAGPWNYLWKDINGNTLQSHTNLPFADTLKQLSGGVFYLEVSTTGLCDNFSGLFNLPGMILPSAQFLSPDSVNNDMSPLVSFTNTSANATSFEWDFGDGNLLSYTQQGQHVYTAAGNYTVVLRCKSFTGCEDSVRKKIVVYTTPSGIQEQEQQDGYRLFNFGENEYRLTYEGDSNEMVTISLSDAYGRKISDLESSTLQHSNIDFSLKRYSSGIYFLTIQGKTSKKVIKLIVL